MKRYGSLAVAVLLAAIALAVATRLPRPRVPQAPPPSPVPVAELAIEVRDGVVFPDAASVPKDHRVRLAVRNIGAHVTDLKLAGYESRVSCDSLAAGARWTTEFVSDLPGEDFAWMVGGRPAGRLAVTGSHLVEGHR